MSLIQTVLLVLGLYGIYYVGMMLYEMIAGQKTHDDVTSKEEDVDISGIVASFESTRIEDSYLSKKAPAQKIPVPISRRTSGFSPEELENYVTEVYERCEDKTTVVDEIQDLLDCWAYEESQQAA